MKDSGRTSNPAGSEPARSPSPARRFALSGPTRELDPTRNAYRPDVADIALAGQVIASHYAEPSMRTCSSGTDISPIPGDEASGVLTSGETFAVLDCGRGYAWGYRVGDHLVGYVDEDKLKG